MKEKVLLRAVFAWFFIVTFLPYTVKSEIIANSPFTASYPSMSKNIEMVEGQIKTITATRQCSGTTQEQETWWTTISGPISVLNKTMWSITVLALKPGSGQLTHQEGSYSGQYGRDHNLAWYYVYLNIKASNYDKPTITPSIEQTRVAKGMVLKLTSSVSGSTIYYSTTRDVRPGEDSIMPEEGITLNSKTTIRAQAVKSGYPLSDVFERTYEVVESDFQATVAGGNVIYFKIISEEDKTCQVVYVPEEATGTLRIPKLINGYTVTAIGEQAIAHCQGIASVIIPASITSIGKNAFEDCTGLNTLTLPEGLTQIGEGAFNGCTELTSINIPASVTSFGKSTFAGCTALSDVDMATGLTLIGEQAFAGCTAITSLSLPNSLTQLGSNAFNGCTGLTSVTLPNSIANFGTATFKGCSGLQTVNVSNGLQDIGVQTFADCTSLTSVNLPTSLQKVGNSVFSGCVGLTSIVIPSGVTEISTSAFKNCSSLHEVTFPTTLTTIESSAFAGCAALNAISLPAAITTIGESAFNACNGLTSLVIPKAVTTVGKNAFAGCSQLKTVTIESNSLVSNNYTSTTSLETVFGEQVEEYVLGEQITSIGNYVFYGCDQLTAIVIPASITTIGNYAFRGCSGLTNVTLPLRITSIGNFAFNGCSGLTSIIIPASVTAIGNKAFYGCPTMKTITSYITEPYIISDNVFTCYDETVTLFVPYGTSDMYWSVSGWIQFMNIEEMPLVVTDITLPSNQVVYNGRNIILEPTIIPVDAQTTLTWTSDDANIATVDSNGQVTGVAEGTTTIRVTTDNGLTASCQIKVIGIIDFADATVKALCIANWDTNGDGELDKDEAAAVTSIGKVFSGKKITSFNELMYFVGLTSIDDNAFNYCFNLTSITIPNNVTSIGSCAFYYCICLTSVTLGNRVMSIGYDAFSYCYELTSISIPNSVTSIGNEAFSFCHQLTTIVVESGNTKYDSRANCNAIIETSTSTLIAGCNNTIIPNDVQSIGDSAFRGRNVVSISIPDGVISIGKSAFSGCSSLTSVTIPNSVTSIGYDAFYACSMASVIIPENITEISRSAFRNCQNLTEINIPKSVISIGNSAFEGCTGLKAVNITDLDAYCRISFGCYAPLYYAHHLYLNGKEVTGEISFPNDISNISTCAFEGCYGIESVVVPEGITTIGLAAFKNCPNLKSITLPSTLKTIVKEAFQECTSLTSVTIPCNVSTIGDKAFSDCSEMKYVKVKNATPITISDAFNATDQTAVLCVPRNSKAAYEAAEYWKNFHYIAECPDSDVNQDGRVDVVDVVDIARYVVDNPADSFREYLADLNEDDDVNVADAVVLVNEIAGQTDWQVKRMEACCGETDTRDALYLAKDADGSLSLHLDGETCFTAFQCSLHLSDAALVESIKLNADRKSGHQLLCHQVGDGEYRVVVLSLSSQAFNGQKGALLHIGLDGELGELSVSDIQFVTPQGNIYLFDELSSDNAIDWDGVTIMEDISERHGVDHPAIFNLHGQRLTVPQRGVNIVVGKKVFIK